MQGAGPGDAGGLFQLYDSKSAMSPLKLNKAYINVIVFDTFICAALALFILQSLPLSCYVKVHATRLLGPKLIAYVTFTHAKHYVITQILKFAN